ncbi:MAG: DNA primase catalytic subunit PriS, partial [Methanothrix sp.]
LLTFLLSDFGFAESKMSVVFSGGRGYHIHVRDPRIMRLGSDERREVVDYLTGRGLDIERLRYKVVLSGDVGDDKVRALRCRPKNSPGWGNRFNDAIVKFAEDIRDMDEKSAVMKLTEIKSIGKVRAIDFYERIKSDQVLDDIRSGNLDTLNGIQGIWKYVIDNYLANEFVQVLGGETDEPVTADVRRLIRCPGSLHGGSGFRVTPLSLQSLEEFDPLQDAVVFGDDPVPLQILKPFNTEIRGESYHLTEGPTEVPMCAAVFLMARGVAEARAKL